MKHPNFEPKTGVIAINEVSQLVGDDSMRGIDLDFEDHCAECKNEEHDSCYSGENSTMLIGGWKQDGDGKYMPDETAEYSAIVSEIYVQVVHSKTILFTSKCSPCFPDQGDLGTMGSIPTYALPLDAYDDELLADLNEKLAWSIVKMEEVLAEYFVFTQQVYETLEILPMDILKKHYEGALQGYLQVRNFPVNQ